jgi:hypothetical protein
MRSFNHPNVAERFVIWEIQANYDAGSRMSYPGMFQQALAQKSRHAGLGSCNPGGNSA